MSDSVFMLAMLPVLLVFSAVASGSETALFRLTHRERTGLMRESPAVAAAVGVLLADPRRLLLLILIVNMIVNVAYFVVSSILTSRVGSPGLGVVVGVGSVLGVVIFGEILAKVLAGRMRLGFCGVFARPLAGLLMIAGPVLLGIDRFALSPMIRLMRPTGSAGEILTGLELRGLVESGRESGAIGETARRLLEEVLELGELRVREAMMPRDRIDWIGDDADRDEVLSRAASSRVTTMLVCRGGLDGELIGTMHVKRFLAGDPAGAIEPVLVVPEQGRLDVVLEQMRERGVTRAVCVDERGALVGMIRAADIVDELLAGMGEGAGDERHAVRLVGLGVWSVPSGLSARDWAQAFGVDESEIADALVRSGTIGGVVIDRLGRLASVGDEARIGNALVRVAKVTGRRIDLLEVSLVDDEASEGAA